MKMAPSRIWPERHLLTFSRTRDAKRRKGIKAASASGGKEGALGNQTCDNKKQKISGSEGRRGEFFSNLRRGARIVGTRRSSTLLHFWMTKKVVGGCTEGTEKAFSSIQRSGAGSSDAPVGETRDHWENW